MTTDRKIALYDTTLRDGSQRRGISYSLADKIRISKLLDSLGVAYIEGGWPGSNPKDCEYFERLKDISLEHARPVAFGSTRHAQKTVEDDPQVAMLLAAATPVITLVGKAWDLHVTEVLNTTPEENLRMVQDSIRYLKEHGREVIFDAEHFFDGYRANPAYTFEVLAAAAEAGADWLVLCDTNGGSLPDDISRIVRSVSQTLPTPLGIHTHNDMELAVANTLAAVSAGCTQVQGTINGYGERCGNANLISIIPNLQLKMGYTCIPATTIEKLTGLSRTISEIANLTPDDHAAFVGAAAFAHKGGIHVAAVEKLPESYEHIAPELVGNVRDFVVSELSGRSNIRLRARELGIELNGSEKEILTTIKDLEARGLTFDNAEGSFELLLRRKQKSYRAPFSLTDSMVVSERRQQHTLKVEAIVKVQVDDEIFHTVSDGDGPVHALDAALRKALLPRYPQLSDVKLVDYKVRILDPDRATAATTRVTIHARADGQWWSTVGCSDNIIEASIFALSDSFELYLLRQQQD